MLEIYSPTFTEGVICCFTSGLSFCWHIFCYRRLIRNYGGHPINTREVRLILDKELRNIIVDKIALLGLVMGLWIAIGGVWPYLGLSFLLGRILAVVMIRVYWFKLKRFEGFSEWEDDLERALASLKKLKR